MAKQINLDTIGPRLTVNGVRWYARRTIQAVLDGFNMDVAQPEAVGRAIDAAYPFRDQRGFSYGAWLAERQLARVQLGLEQPKPAPPAKPDGVTRNELIAMGQQTLFDEV